MSKISLQTIKKSTKYVLIWYIITLIMLLAYIVIGKLLDTDVFFHPIISIFMRIVLIFDLFVLPLFLATKYILKDDATIIEKILNIFLASICAGIITVFFFFNFVYLEYGKAIFNFGTVKMEISNEIIIVQDSIWGEDYNAVYNYKVENFFFVRRIYNVR